MIHAKYCYDSDPIDRWFKEEVEIDDLLYWHLEKYFEPDNIQLEDESRWEFYVHWGGYRITLGEMLNQPVRAVLNQPGIWVPDKFETFPLKSRVIIELNSVEVYNRESASIVEDGINWAASRLGGEGAQVSLMKLGDGNMATTPDMHGLVGAELGIGPLDPMGGKPAGMGIDFTAEFPPGVGTGLVREIGLFAMNRVMLSRESIATGINKQSVDRLLVKWRWSIA